MVEAASRVVEVLVGEKVDVVAALGFIYLGNLGGKIRGREDATKCSREGRVKSL